MNFLVIGAHPDDCEIKCGGTAILLTRAGHTVHFVSATNGEKGHHLQSGEQLISRRRAEAAAAARILGVQSHLLDVPDGEIQPDLQTRWQFIRLIRAIAPDVIITHRPWDYHPDHRITGQLVQDCSYLVRVPQVCPDAPIPPVQPVILYMSDPFTVPVPFAPDLAIGIDDVYPQKLRALHCHESQVYEWLPWIDGRTESLPATESDRLPWLDNWLRPRDVNAAEGARSLLSDYDASAGKSIELAETYQLSEYGRQVNPDELRAQWGI